MRRYCRGCRVSLNKTQQYVLRAVFGSDDGDVRVGPQPLMLRRGSREHTFAKELVDLGVALFRTTPQGWLSIEQANPTGKTLIRFGGKVGEVFIDGGAA